MILYEHRSAVMRPGSPILVEKEELTRRVGYRSIFGFAKAAADQIRYKNNMRGLQLVPLFADTIFLDFDDAEDAYRASLLKLDNLGWAYKAFTTGGRGYHIHIEAVETTTFNLPKRMKIFTQREFPGSDPNIYKCSGIIRLEGTTHEKTGNTKDMLLDRPGSKVIIPSLSVREQIQVVANDEQRGHQGQTLVLLLARSPAEGGRNTHGFKIVASCHCLNLTKPEARDLLAVWNSQLAKPMSNHEVYTLVNSAYRR